jgi:diacylglycerol kinase family enzyme
MAVNVDGNVLKERQLNIQLLPKPLRLIVHRQGDTKA